MDLMVSKMLEYGLTIEDLSHLERLSDPEILSRMDKEKRDGLNKNSREDLVFYLQVWAKLLREKWIKESPLSPLIDSEKKLKFPALV
jgi:hypothetical protein